MRLVKWSPEDNVPVKGMTVTLAGLTPTSQVLPCAPHLPCKGNRQDMCRSGGKFTNFIINRSIIDILRASQLSVKMDQLIVIARTPEREEGPSHCR